MSGKEKYSDALFDAVGEIDDAFVNEAQNYRAADIKNRRFIKFASIAASVLIVMTAVLPIVLFASLTHGGNSAKPSNGGPEVMTTGENTLPMGTAALIWKSEGESDYKYVVLDKKSARSYAESITFTPVSSKDSGIRVWIALGNGEYVSPQLKKSSGNVGLDLFDFSPESKLPETISRIIERCENGD